MKKRGFNLKAHPLTIISGCVFILTGKPIEVISYIFVVIFHEFLHYLIAKKLNVCLEDVTITPFGGCLKGELLGIPREKTLLITLLPPILNLVTSASIFALWWLFPTLYPYTEAIAYANLSVGGINLLPCYPLDGGRAAITIFQTHEKLSRRIVSALSVVFSVVALSLFVMSVVSKSINLSYLTMSVFMLFGAFYEEKKDYVEIKLKRVLKKKKRGILPVKGYFVEESSDYELLSMLDYDSYYVFLRKNKEGRTIVESEEDFLRRIKNK